MIKNIQEFFYFLSIASLFIACLLLSIIQFRRSHWWGSVPIEERLFGELKPFEKKLAKWSGLFFLFACLFLAVGLFI
jgi:hypothetical protein